MTPWSRSHQPVPAPPTRSPDTRRKPAVTTSDDDGDDDANAQSAWPIAYATQQRRSGEDAQAKTRYLDVLNRAQFPAIDYEAAQQFVYPTNYAVREYQLTITEKALYHNTLVSLPTGLGKTLIASVVMYNFYRWFPTGKIVFMAPTKPLVAQQIQACHEIMGIPLTDTAELQGNVPPSRRKTLWRDKRVFFCTPQSMQNDLRHGICEAERFVCLVVDEAHRATGNYAYCCVIQEVERKTPFFRVLALSATPGSKFEVIQDVIKNLRISHIESRSADDADVKKYTHARQEEVIKCTLSSQITEVKAIFLGVFQRITQRLVQGNIIQHRDPEKLSRWYVLQMREKFRQSPSYQANRAAESDLALLVSLLHAKELLTVHGLSSFHEYVNGWIEERESGARLSWSKKEMMASPEFHNLVLRLDAYSTGPAASGAASSGKSSSHPKLLKLREVLHEHFQRHATGGSSTRAIVFTQYRTSVNEIVGLLAPLAPLLKVQAFVGQGASGKAKESKGQSQKQQQEIVRKFRDGAFNVLVATCIAEEGLDIGEVDLIVSFDALTSPVRMIQRMGRTGRKRVGKVIILVTEGDEEKKLARSVASAKTVSRAMTTFKSKFVYAKCPRMLPHGVQPALSKLEMTIPEFHASQVGGKNQQRSAGTRTSSDETARRRWQLNEIEKAIAAAKYTPADWASRPRNAIFPVTARSRHLLRRVHIRIRGTERVEADTFRVGHSARSNALRQLVRSVHGVTETDDEVVELASDDDDGDDSVDISDARARSSAVSARQAAERTHGQETAAETQSHAPAHDFSLSAAADESFSGRAAHDASFASEDMHHFSPGWLDAASPIRAAPAPSSTARTTAATTPRVSTAPAVVASPVAPVVAPAPVPAPATPAPTHTSTKPTHHEAKSATPATAPAPASTPGRKASAVESSPGRRVRPALSSPSPKRGKREKTKRSGADHASKESAGDAKEFERGEALIQRLRDLVAAAEAASPVSLCSPEPETHNSQGASAGSQSTKALGALPSFPRITRRLDFEAVALKSLSVSTGANCVPEAPPLEQFPQAPSPPKQVLPAPPPLEPFSMAPPPPEPFLVAPSLLIPVPGAPKSHSPVLSPEDEPVFALLPALTISNEDKDTDVVMADAPVAQTSRTPDAVAPDDRIVRKPAAAVAEPTEPSKPKRSLALRRTTGSAGDAQQTHQSALAPSPLPSPLASPTAAPSTNAVPTAPRSTTAVAPSTVHIETSSSSTAAAVAVAPKSAPVVFDIGDFDDFDDAPAARTPVKRPPPAPRVASKAPPANRSSPSQRRAKDDASVAATPVSTPSDCCAVCTEVESYEDDPIVYCDGCELGVHQFCYGIASVPSGSWFCDSCVAVNDAKRARTSPYFGGASAAPPRCALCPVRGGALKKTLCGRWAHVQCFMWLPELQLAPDCDVLTLGSLKQLDPDRNTLDCSLCHSRTGRGIIQCAYKRCLTAFHVSCAAFAHYALVQEQPDGGDTLFLAYCPLHARKRLPRASETRERQAVASPPPQQHEPQTPAKPLAAAPPTSRTTPSPSALLFSPSDGDSAKKFRKFRRLKRKYDASQRTSQSPSGVPTASSSSTDRASTVRTWGKRMKRSQQYSEGQKKQAVAIARMFIEDDVEVRGDDDDDYGDDDDDDEPNELDDSFINDSSQLLYSPTSPPSRSGKKRKRASPGDMRAIYARSLLESQHDLPSFMRRGQRDFGALPQHGIINACLQELRSAPSPASSAASSMLSPAPSVRSAAGTTPGAQQQSPISLLSPDGPSSSTQAATPSTAPPITPEVRRCLEPKRFDNDEDGDDDYERTSAAPPKFSLLTVPSAIVSARPSGALPPRSPAPHQSARVDTQATKAIAVNDDEDRSLQERIEANRLRALEKLRERQLKQQQRAQTGPAPHAMSFTTPVNASVASSSSHSSTSTLPSHAPAPVAPAPHARASANAVPFAPPSFALLPSPSPPAVASVSDSQANAVPEAPSFSLFPAFAHEPVAIDLTDSHTTPVPVLAVPVPPRKAPEPQHVPMPPPPPSPPVRPPQVVVFVSSSCSLSPLFPTLIAARPPETAVEIDDSLEADVLVSARVAGVTLSHDALAASLARTESDLFASLPHLRTCTSVFKRVLVLVRAPDAASASALSRSPALERLRQSSAASLDVVIRASDEQLCRHVFDVALYVLLCLVALCVVCLTDWLCSLALLCCCSFLDTRRPQALACSHATARPPRRATPWTRRSTRGSRTFGRSRSCRSGVRCR